MKRRPAAVTFIPSCFKVGGKPAILRSGEFHYFRVPRRDWRRRMRLFKQAGGNCLATYVPWLIHEPEEGRFSFGGRGGTHDVEGFLALAAEEGLPVIVRPGPYQYSELRYCGLAPWLCENYPEARARDLSGRSFRKDSMSYLHPVFLEKVHRWFAEVCPRLARFTVARGGSVAMAQIDNELAGIHVWFGGLDYNAETMGFGKTDGRYPRYLNAQYSTVERMNSACGTAFASFADARPLLQGQSGVAADIRRRRDYFRFYLECLAEYGFILAGWLRDFGIDVPVVHNSANPGMNSWFKPMVEKLGNSFLLGSDHYYNLSQDWAQNNPTPQYAVRVFTSLEMLRLFRRPPTVFELPGGSCSDWPPITPSDADACYRANLALGMKGLNYYIFTGGPNIPGTGATSDLYDYGAAVGAKGEIRPLYYVQKRFHAVLRRHAWLAEAGQEYDVRITLDWDSSLADRFWQVRGNFLLDPAEAWNFIRKGILPTAFCAGFSPQFVDLDSAGWCSDYRTPLVVVCSASMSCVYQERVVRFLRGGGRALILPVLPTHDENCDQCTVLADFLGRPGVTRSAQEEFRIDVAGVNNIFKNGDVYFFDNLPKRAEVIGRDALTGRTMAWHWRTPGNGEAIIMGFSWSHSHREHHAMLSALLRRLSVNPVIRCSNPNIWCTLRTAGENSMLFLMNLLSAPQIASASCRPRWSRKKIDAGMFRLPPMSVKLVFLRRQ